MGAWEYVEQFDMAQVLPWLLIDEADPDIVLVSVVGGVAASRAADLWSDLESALELAAGRRVVVDLTAVSTFDVDTIGAMTWVAKTVRRRHEDLCAVMRSSSALAQYARECGLNQLLTIHPSTFEARCAAGPDALSPGAA